MRKLVFISIVFLLCFIPLIGNAYQCTVLTYYLYPSVADATTSGQVSILQQFLKDDGVYSDEITGFYGPVTEAAVKAFQTKYGIEPVGVVGPLTRAKIQEVSCGTSLSSSITNFVLYNADTNQPLQVLDPNATLNLALLPTANLNIIANTSGQVESVKFGYDGTADYRTDNESPYALGGNSGSDILAWTPSVGSHTVTAVPYSQDNAGGTLGASKTVSFQVTSQTESPPLAATLPKAPTNLAVAVVSTNQVNVTWMDNSDNETGFIIERSINGISFIEAGRVSAGAAAFSDNGLSPTLYYYRVSAYNSAGTSANALQLVTPSGPLVVTIPSAPVTLTAQAVSSTQINLTWVDTSNNEDGFLLERALAGGAYATVATLPAGTTNYNNTGLAANSSYSYRLRAYNSAGNSLYSNSATLYTQLDPVSSGSFSVTSLTLYNADTDSPIQVLENGAVIDLGTLPTPRVNIIADTSGSIGSVRFGLDGNLSYRIENGSPYALESNSGTDIFPWTPSLGTHTVTATPFSAIDATGTVGGAKTVSFTVSQSSGGIGGISVPAAATGLSAQAISDTEIRLSWSDNSNDETGFKIERALGSGTFTEIAQVGMNVSTYTSAGLVAGTDYSYRVRAFNATGSSGYTNIASATTLSPDLTSIDGPNPVITFTANSQNGMASHTVHAHGLNSTLNAGNALTATYEWDFGDPNGKYNRLRGWNVAHVYDNSGTYTIRLTITNEGGKVGVRTATVAISSNTRKKIYVSTAGSDSNDGSQSNPVRSFSRAVGMAGNNSEVLFRRGDTFSLGTGMSIPYTNVTIGAYGSGSRPVLRHTSTSGYPSYFYTSGEDITIRDLAFDTSFGDNHAISAGGRDITVRGNEFIQAGYAVNTNRRPTGVLLQDNTAPSAGLRRYLSWIEGSDHVYLGNYVQETRAHVLRMGGVDRILVAYNNLRNPLSDDIIRGTLTIHQGSYAYIANNTLQEGKATIGPLGEGDGLPEKEARWKWAVFENNIINSNVIVEHGAEHILFRNNVVRSNDSYGIQIEGYSTTYGRGVVDITLDKNTGINSGTKGRFIDVRGSVNGITLKNNLYVAQNIQPGAFSTAAVYVLENDLGSFQTISNNVWPMPNTILSGADGGINYVWPSWQNNAGYKTPAEWNAYSKVNNDRFMNVSLDSNNNPTSNIGSVGARF